LVDFRNILCSRQQPVYESDGIHLNPNGDRMVAAKMGEFLKQKFGSSRGLAGRLELGAKRPTPGVPAGR
jgi:hypothetical protein